jgi:hypothetical protein
MALQEGWVAPWKAALIRCLLLGAVLLPLAHADGMDVLAKLSAHEFSALERHYEEVESKFERRELSERDLIQAYYPFYRKEDTLSDDFAAWIEQRPASALARLSRGIYFRKLGEFRRGERYDHQTRAADVEYMKQMHAKAKEDLLAAFRQRPGSYIAVLHLLNIAQFEIDREAARAYLDTANRLVPGNLFARARYLISLAPKWHGSHEQMDAFVQESKASGVTMQLGRCLEAIVSDDRADMAFYRGDDAAAATHAAEALRLAKDAGQQFQADFLKFSVWYEKAGRPASGGNKPGRSWWEHAIQWAVWGIVMSVVMGWAARSRLKQRSEQHADEMRHPPSTLIMGIFGFVLFGALGVMSNTIGKNETTNVWTRLVFLFFALMSLATIADYFLARHRLTPDGLEFGRLFGRRGELVWVDVSSVEYASVMKWFRIRTKQGATIRISAMLMGLRAFAQQVLSQVPAHQITEPTRSILEEAADGRPPPVWG